jgi:hypothetical protein
MDHWKLTSRKTGTTLPLKKYKIEHEKKTLNFFLIRYILIWRNVHLVNVDYLTHIVYSPQNCKNYINRSVREADKGLRQIIVECEELIIICLPYYSLQSPTGSTQ